MISSYETERSFMRRHARPKSTVVRLARAHRIAACLVLCTGVLLVPPTATSGELASVQTEHASESPLSVANYACEPGDFQIGIPFWYVPDTNVPPGTTVCLTNWDYWPHVVGGDINAYLDWEASVRVTFSDEGDFSFSVFRCQLDCIFFVFTASLHVKGGSLSDGSPPPPPRQGPAWVARS
jgi:hypothetical protein